MLQLKRLTETVGCSAGKSTFVWYIALPSLATLRFFTTTYVGNISAFSGYREARSAWGTSDMGSYLAAGSKLVETGSFQGWEWVLNLWSPGNTFLNAICVWLERTSGANFLLWRFLLSGVLVLALVASSIDTCKRLSSTYPMLIAAVVVWISFGAVFPMADGISLMCLTGGMLSLTARKLNRGVILQAFRSSLWFSGAVYFRSQFIFLPHALIALSLLLLLVRVVQSLRRNTSRGRWFRDLFATLRKTPQLDVRILFIVGCFVFLAMLPWLGWREIQNSGRESDVGFGLNWQQATFVMANSQIIPPDSQAGWVRTGGGDVFCKYQALLCELVANYERSLPNPYSPYDGEGFTNAEMRGLVLGAVVSNFSSVTAYKIETVARMAKNDRAIFGARWTTLIFFATSLLLALRTLVYWIGGTRRIDLLSAAIVVYVVGITTVRGYLGHNETRYLLPAAVCMLFFQPRRERKLAEFKSGSSAGPRDAEP